MSRPTCEPSIAGPEEESDPRFRDTPGQTASLARERVPPRHDRPAVTASGGESGDVRRRSPHPAAGGHDDVRREPTQWGKRPLRHVHVAVEAPLVAQAHHHPSQIERPRVELHVLDGQVGLDSPSSVALHRSLGHEEKVDVRTLRQPCPERSHERAHRVDDHGDTRGAPRRCLLRASVCTRCRCAHGNALIRGNGEELLSVRRRSIASAQRHPCVALPWRHVASSASRAGSEWSSEWLSASWAKRPGYDQGLPVPAK